VKISLPPATEQALADLAIAERRDPRSQAELIVIRYLHRRGLVNDEGTERDDRRREAVPA
jgi:hypothetical protein